MVKNKNVCPNCNCADKSTSHINRCPDLGRKKVRSESERDAAKELRKWLDCEQSDPTVTSNAPDLYLHKSTWQRKNAIFSSQHSYMMPLGGVTLWMMER
jgi:hypothetical protein